MKSTLRYAAIGLVSLSLVLTLTFSILSAASVSPGPLAGFERDWSPTSTCLPEAEPQCVRPAPGSWSEQVRDVLAKVVAMEERLEVYSAELQAIEREEKDAAMAEALGLEENSPARSLETLMCRFKEMVDTYEGLADGTRAGLSYIDPAGKVEVLATVASKERELNEYLDGLAERRKAHAEAVASMEMTAFETCMAIRFAARSGAAAAATCAVREALAKARAAEIAVGARAFWKAAASCDAAPSAGPSVLEKAGPEKHDPKPMDGKGE